MNSIDRSSRSGLKTFSRTSTLSPMQWIFKILSCQTIYQITGWALEAQLAHSWVLLFQAADRANDRATSPAFRRPDGRCVGCQYASDFRRLHYHNLSTVKIMVKVLPCTVKTKFCDAQ